MPSIFQFLGERISLRFVKGVKESIFKQMLSNILCQNALLTKCSFHEEHFFGEHFAKEYGRAFLREQKSILAKNMTGFALNRTGFVLNMTGFVLNMIGLVLHMTGFVLNVTVFVLDMTRFVLNMTGFVLNMT